MDTTIVVVIAAAVLILALGGVILGVRLTRRSRALKIAELYGAWAETFGMEPLTDDGKANGELLLEHMPYQWSGGELQSLTFRGDDSKFGLLQARQLLEDTEKLLKKKSKNTLIFDFADAREGDISLRSVPRGSEEERAFITSLAIAELFASEALEVSDFPELALDYNGERLTGFALAQWDGGARPEAAHKAAADALGLAYGGTWLPSVISSTVTRFDHLTEEQESRLLVDDGDDGNGDLGALEGVFNTSDAEVMAKLDGELDQFMSDDDELDGASSWRAETTSGESSFQASEEPLFNEEPAVNGDFDAPVNSSSDGELALEAELPVERSAAEELSMPVPTLPSGATPTSKEEPEESYSKHQAEEPVGYDHFYDEPVFANSAKEVEEPRESKLTPQTLILAEAIKLAAERAGGLPADDEPEVIATEGDTPSEFIVYFSESVYTGSPEFRSFLGDMVIILQANFSFEWEGGPLDSPNTYGCLFRIKS